MLKKDIKIFQMEQIVAASSPVLFEAFAQYRLND